MKDNNIVLGSIADLARNQDQTIAESFINADAIIIVDTSGSMDTQILKIIEPVMQWLVKNYQYCKPICQVK